MSLIIRDKFTFKDKLSFITFYVNVMCTLYKINLSRGAKALVSYYILRGINKETHQLFIKEKNASSIRTIHNIRGELRRFDVLINTRENSEYKLCDYFNLHLEDKLGFQLLLENEHR